MNIKRWQILGFFFTIIIGSLLHFVFEWSGEAAVVGAFSAVNESTWEHVKLLIIPMLIFGLFEYLVYGKEVENYIPILFVSILIGMAAIIVLFYTYTGVIGDHFVAIGIIIFVVATALGYWYKAINLNTDKFVSNKESVLGLIGLLVLALMVIIFTYNPPQINLFKDAQTGLYGIPIG